MNLINTQKCKSCVYTDNPDYNYGDPEKSAIVKRCLKAGIHVECHINGKICAGFNKAHPGFSNAQRVAERLEELLNGNNY